MNTTGTATMTGARSMLCGINETSNSTPRCSCSHDEILSTLKTNGGRTSSDVHALYLYWSW